VSRSRPAVTVALMALPLCLLAAALSPHAPAPDVLTGNRLPTPIQCAPLAALFGGAVVSAAAKRATGMTWRGTVLATLLASAIATGGAARLLPSVRAADADWLFLLTLLLVGGSFTLPLWDSATRREEFRLPRAPLFPIAALLGGLLAAFSLADSARSGGTIYPGNALAAAPAAPAVLLLAMAALLAVLDVPPRLSAWVGTLGAALYPSAFILGLIVLQTPALLPGSLGSVVTVGAALFLAFWLARSLK